MYDYYDYALFRDWYDYALTMHGTVGLLLSRYTHISIRRHDVIVRFHIRMTYVIHVKIIVEAILNKIV